jgi:hypothetical protein
VARAGAYTVSSDRERQPGIFLVQHTKRSKKIVWGQHQFRVRADKIAEEFTCECKTWEHIGNVRLMLFICVVVVYHMT